MPKYFINTTGGCEVNRGNLHIESQVLPIEKYPVVPVVNKEGEISLSVIDFPVRGNISPPLPLILQDPYWEKISEEENNIPYKEQFLLLNPDSNTSGTLFQLTECESSYNTASLHINPVRQDDNVFSPIGRPLKLPVRKNTVFLGGLFSGRGNEIQDIQVGIGQIDAEVNSPFILELNPDTKITRIHFYSPNSDNWMNLRLFPNEGPDNKGTIPKMLWERIKVVATTNDRLAILVAEGLLKNKNPESFLYDTPFDTPTVSVKEENGEKRPFFESGHFFPSKYVIANTFVPKDPNRCPHILYFLGPARSGSTAFGMVMAQMPNVYCSYFQPHKNGLRHGEPIIIPPVEEKWVVMKDTLGPKYPEELFNPIEMLLEAGVPKEKISVILTLRNPFNCFGSLTKFVPEMDPEYFTSMQEHILRLYETYNQLGIKVVPFSYDLFGHPIGEKEVLQKLMKQIGFSLPEEISLSFNTEQLRGKMVWGEAENPTYYEQVIAPTLNKDYFRYTNNTPDLPEEIKSFLKTKCLPLYEEFHALSRNVLGLPLRTNQYK